VSEAAPAANGWPPRFHLLYNAAMDIHVFPDGTLEWSGHRVRCAVGRAGVRTDKREGDGATPAGVFDVRSVMYRPDRIARPRTALLVRAIDANDGWCDDPGDPAYNRLIRLPHPARHERLWRDDGLYDLIAVIGYNDDPVVPGAGSAIFLHGAGPGYPPTEGCIALAIGDLVAVLAECAPGDRIIVSENARAAPRG